MGQQLNLFDCESSTLESKALLLVELDNEIIDLMAERKELAEATSAERKDINQRLRDAKSRRAEASKDLYSLKKAGV
jgi:dsDNA-specific endonuclease/ATPase MutS2